MGDGRREPGARAARGSRAAASPSWPRRPGADQLRALLDLPAEIRGRSSILYVDPDDASRGKPRRYTVWVDEPITARMSRGACERPMPRR